MARHLNVILPMMLLAIYVLMGRKVTASRKGQEKWGKGHPREEVLQNEKKEKLWVQTHSQNRIVGHRRNCLQV